MKNLMVRRSLIGTVLTLLILGSGYALMEKLGSRVPEVRQMSFQESKKAVRVTPVEYKTRELALSSMGRVIPERATDLMAEVQGEMLPGDVPLKPGQRFGEGQVLFRIDDREAKLALYAQKSDFMTTLAGILPDLKLDYPEAYPAWQAYFESLQVDTPLPPLPEITQPAEKVFLSSRNILSQFYTLRSNEERLTKYVVKAPFSGSILEVLQDLSSIVSPGTRVARISRSARMELEVPIAREDLDFLPRGTQVDVYSEDGNQRWTGQVTRIGAAMDPATQSINVYVSFQPGRTPVFEGQYLRMQVPGSRLRDVMEIPRNAIVNRNDLYVVNDSNRLRIARGRIEKV
ncbi:MAG: HlyD family efflux transporter periplasmic adaptor subunit, partial [Bacteroidetes bacterium]